MKIVPIDNHQAPPTHQNSESVETAYAELVAAIAAFNEVHHGDDPPPLTGRVKFP